MTRESLEKSIAPQIRTSAMTRDVNVNNSDMSLPQYQKQDGAVESITEMDPSFNGKGVLPKENTLGINYTQELIAQQQTALSEVKQLRSKLAESLGEHHGMKRDLDELRTQVYLNYNNHMIIIEHRCLYRILGKINI